MRISLSAKKAFAVITSALTVTAGASLVTPQAHAAPGNTVIIGDSLPANPTVESYLGGRFNLPGTPINKAGCPTDNTFSRNYGEARGAEVSDYTCAGASYFTGGRHLKDLAQQAHAQGDLNAGTAEVVLFAGANDTYPHVLGQRLPVATIQEMLRVGMTDTINEVRAKAPQARIKVVGYPRISNDQNQVCLINIIPGQPAPSNVVRIGEIENSLQAAAVQAAQATGATFVDLKPISTGHEMCSNDRWIVGVVDTTSSARALMLHMTWEGLSAVARHAGTV